MTSSPTITLNNGVAMPAIAIRDENGTIREARRFGYDDYKASLS